MEEIGGKVSLDNCLNAVLLALCLVMAGSGNIRLFSFARQQHKRCSTDVTYGSHMAAHMAIGFLFLGGGRYTLKTDDLSIACLLCSLYPKWPITSKDNTYHLQALRHLYVLACEPRLFVTRDVDTRKICYTPIQVKLKETDFYDETSIKLLSPCFIPELKNIKQIEILGPRYRTTVFNLENSSFDGKDLDHIFVKRRAGYLPYTEDPKGKKNLLARNFSDQSEKLELIKSFNSNEDISLFAQLFCSSAHNIGDLTEKHVERYSNILYECVTKDKVDSLKDYIAIEETLCEIERGCIRASSVDQLKLVICYYENVHPKLLKRGVVKEPLIDRLYLVQASIRLEKSLERVSR